MIDALLIIALVCAAVIGVTIVCIIAFVVWALVYTVYCAMKGKPHPFDNNPIKKSFDTDEESK